MKKTIILFLLVTTAVFSQENKYERIKALKTAFITEQLGLSPSEAEKFWPVYNKFESQSYELRLRKNKGLYENLEKGFENLSEDEANQMIEEYIAIETTQLENKKQKIKALGKVLSPQKIIGLRKAEDNFKHELHNTYHRGKVQQENMPKRKKPKIYSRVCLVISRMKDGSHPSFPLR